MQDKELQNTIDEGVRLWGLVQRYAKLELVEHLSFLLTVFIVGGIMFALCAVAVFCFCMYMVSVIETLIGSLPLSYLIVGTSLLIVSLLVYLFRKTLISSPLIKSLMKQMFGDDTLNSELSHEESVQTS